MILFLIGFALGYLIDRPLYALLNRLNKAKPSQWTGYVILAVILFFIGVVWHLTSNVWQVGFERFILGAIAGFLTAEWILWRPQAHYSHLIVVVTLLIAGVFFDTLEPLLRRISSFQAGSLSIQVNGDGISGPSIDLSQFELPDSPIDSTEESAQGMAERREVFRSDRQIIVAAWQHYELMASNSKLYGRDRQAFRANMKDIEVVINHWNQLRFFNETFIDPLIRCLGSRENARYRPAESYYHVAPLVDKLGDLVAAIRSVPYQNTANADADTALHKKSILDFISSVEDLMSNLASSPRVGIECGPIQYTKLPINISSVSQFYSGDLFFTKSGEMRRRYNVKIGEYKDYKSLQSGIDWAGIESGRDHGGGHITREPRNIYGLHLPSFVDSIRHYPHIDLLLANLHALLGDHRSAVRWSRSALSIVRNPATNSHPGLRYDRIVKNLLAFRTNVIADRHMTKFKELWNLRALADAVRRDAVRSYALLASEIRPVREAVISGKNPDYVSKIVFDTESSCAKSAPLGETLYISHVIMLNNLFYFGADDRKQESEFRKELEFFREHSDLKCAPYYWKNSRYSIMGLQASFVDTLGRITLGKARRMAHGFIRDRKVICGLLTDAERQFAEALKLTQLSERSTSTVETLLSSPIDFQVGKSNEPLVSHHLKVTTDFLREC